MIVAVIYETIVGQCDDFLELSAEFATEIKRSHAGCKRYDVVKVGKNTVLFVEEYDSIRDHEHHLKGQDLANFRVRRKEMICSKMEFSGEKYQK